MPVNTYDCAIIGGGLAGLSLAIQLARSGLSVVVFEKGSYPQHKVCGEYISMESWPFLQSLGLALDELGLPKINKLRVSAPSGYLMQADLQLGGFGISRYSLDAALCDLARKAGAQVLEQCKVQDIQVVQAGEQTLIQSSKGEYSARLVCGAYGKYSPKFIPEEKRKEQYIGVKYHIRTEFPSDRIELHNFEDGYCGISQVDKEQYCLCYLANARVLRKAGNSIEALEEEFLYQNPYLKHYYQNSDFLYEKALVISNIYFHSKKAHRKDLLMLGDAAGAISPLCGNGMSMAFRASALLAPLLLSYHKAEFGYEELGARYEAAWQGQFRSRIAWGNRLQGLFGKARSTRLALSLLNAVPPLRKKLISLTHGQPFGSS